MVPKLSSPPSCPPCDVAAAPARTTWHLTLAVAPRSATCRSGSTLTSQSLGGRRESLRVRETSPAELRETHLECWHIGTQRRDREEEEEEEEKTQQVFEGLFSNMH